MIVIFIILIGVSGAYILTLFFTILPHCIDGYEETKLHRRWTKRNRNKKKIDKIIKRKFNHDVGSIILSYCSI